MGLEPAQCLKHCMPLTGIESRPPGCWFRHLEVNKRLALCSAERPFPSFLAIFTSYCTSEIELKSSRGYINHRFIRALIFDRDLVHLQAGGSRDLAAWLLHTPLKNILWNRWRVGDVYSSSTNYRLSTLKRFCGLVVRAPGYRSRGAGSISDITCYFWEVVGLERGPLSLLSTTEELLERKVAAPV
jgi:hypothetical protein